ncbi:hypothetical protein SERLA73DRAFT_118025 [Serpula lacrymans var. lacrymans S7.3]|uniref:VPS9 domain-containing protein n=1 Tax=Serpula lacrymans var. lacrymans (strain S7.3) TaxID=936435 RepID=F8QIG5_SERL3|nr:hypothetical protein SERLA73DRAFT_118025 [Serpula lacrymans var. lacrymans S7.3]
MATKREGLFPPSSIGRIQGANIKRVSSFETLSAHPLLSPTSSSTSLISPPPEQNINAAPTTAAAKYVPYTPRQRVVTTSATTGTTLHPSVSVSPQQPQGGATSKLQLMNLKAAAQGLGLDIGSVGWAILEKLTTEGEVSDDWSEVWNILTKGKASLLLPLEKASSHEKITVEFVQDHVVLCDTSSRDDVPFVTLSGLRGVLVNEVLTFRSALLPSSKPFQDLLALSSRTSTLVSLPPLPSWSSSPTPYPSFSVPAFNDALPLPPRPFVLNKPPLPPRPIARPSSAQGTSRISNPFASLFGQKPSTPPTATVPLPTQSEPELVVELSAFSIDRSIVSRDVRRDIVDALSSEMHEAFMGLPTWVVDRVQSFTTFLHPLVKASKKTLQDIGSSPAKMPYIINPLTESPEEISEKLQEFYSTLEQDLWTGQTSLRRKEGPSVEFGDDKERQDKFKAEDDLRIREILELVECTICTLFYDRLFLPFTSDDASHDEALSSRIAAMNMVDLGLEHLDVDTGMIGPELDVVVKACGEMLNQLDVACRSPSDKAAVLVAAHKVVVDGLSKLPPVKLKADQDAEENQIAFTKTVRDEHVVSTPPLGPMEGVDVPLLASSDTLTASPVSTPVLMVPDPHTGPPTSESHIISPEVSHHSRSNSPRLMVSPPSESTPVSGDVLLPLIIFSVVKSNPPHLVSHLLFTQRYRNQSFGGEESYCLINLMAVAEFLENVDLGALGLGESEKEVISTADLTPIPINRSPLTPESPALTQEGLPGSFRGRVEQQVDAIAGSANKVISGVVDSSFGVLRSLSFLPGHNDNPVTPAKSTESAPPWNVRPGLGLLRREAGFSIASLTASLPGTREKAKSAKDAEEAGQQLVPVSSRPSSVKSVYLNDEDGPYLSEKAEDESEENEEEDEEEEEEDEEEEEEVHDGRSIRSFERMMNSSKPRKRKQVSGRKSLTDRLAQMSGLSRLAQSEAHNKASSPISRPSTLLAPANRHDTPASSRAQSPISLRLPPPNRRFLDCSEDDIKVGEVAELLREYKHLVEAVRALGGFDE